MTWIFHTQKNLLLEREDNFCKEYRWSRYCQAHERGCVKIPEELLKWEKQQNVYFTGHRQKLRCSSRELFQNLWGGYTHTPEKIFQTIWLIALTSKSEEGD